ncbi:Pregnancy-associated plasma protein-A [Flaviramulus basaltis]|uniref:Pregnancy-associated plasma protein-A n=1 Tax=Flaviramulus basaltis TaxID=369401 RepID=A0A1K2IBF4_9FLAO|nr:zinc metalloprotease [Flaviramulus basaltis]SFZ89741.1 Pregnancy-associated plasma protein-A [Flaviramulus basaltis]
MKKLLLSMAAIALLFTACDDEKNEIVQEQEIDMSDFYVYTDFNEDLGSKSANSKEKFKTCYSMNVLNKQLDANPGLAKKMFDVEYQTRKFITAKGKPGGNPGGGGSGGGGSDVDVLPIEDGLGTINIPVYIHIVLPNANDVSNSQIQSQISVLNNDFSSTNTNLLPSGATDFINDATTTGVSFSLAQTFRYNNSTSSWGTNDSVKSAYPPITPETHLNIWVCNIGGGILGYAQFPGGNLSTDGVVLLHSSLPGGSAAPYNLGRTATHEVGHYLNLRHIWGDGRCKQDDFVTDTPSSNGANYGCPSFPTVNCNTTDMTMNYMDYTDDACMYMFTDGQRNRMRAIFASGGARDTMAGN